MMRHVLVLVTAALPAMCLDGASSNGVCPPLYSYSAEEQLQAKAELERLGPSSILDRRFMPEYGQVRRATRVCMGLAPEG